MKMLVTVLSVVVLNASVAWAAWPTNVTPVKGEKGKTQDHTRSVKLNATANPYNVVIGVAGPKGVTVGEYSLAIAIQ